MNEQGPPDPKFKLVQYVRHEHLEQIESEMGKFGESVLNMIVLSKFGIYVTIERTFTAIRDCSLSLPSTLAPSTAA